MPIKFCSEAYFFRRVSLTSLKSQTRDPRIRGLVLRFLCPEKIHQHREPWISRRARYPKDHLGVYLRL